MLIRVDKPRLGRGQLSLPLVNRGFERLFLDREHDLAFFDIVSVLEQPSTEKALHAGPQIDFFKRLGPPDVLGLLFHGPQLRRLDQDSRHRSRLLGVRQANHG